MAGVVLEPQVLGAPRDGGLAALIATETKTIEATDELLTLKGLKILFQRNQS